MSNPRVPVELKKLRGTDQPSRRAPKVSGQFEVPRMPRGIAREAIPYWRKIVHLVAARGILLPTDILALQDMCEVLARLKECEELLTTEGLITEGKYGPIRNPASMMANAYRAAWLKYATRFALTPVDRAGITAEAPEEKSLSEQLDEAIKEGRLVA